MTSSRHLGTFSAEREYAETQIERGGEAVRVDLNLAAPAAFSQTEADEVDRVIDAVNASGGLDAEARRAFTGVMDDEEEEPVKFWRFHKDEVEEHAGLAPEAFVEQLQLKRVGFYPDGAFGAKAYVVLDYALRGPMTDQLLVAKFSRDGSLLEISWES